MHIAKFLSQRSVITTAGKAWQSDRPGGGLFYHIMVIGVGSSTSRMPVLSNVLSYIGLLWRMIALYIT